LLGAASCGSQSESRNQGKSEASTNLEVTIKGGDPKARAALSSNLFMFHFIK
jgi:hypothetical protein